MMIWILWEIGLILASLVIGYVAMNYIELIIGGKKRLEDCDAKSKVYIAAKLHEARIKAVCYSAIFFVSAFAVVDNLINNIIW